MMEVMQCCADRYFERSMLCFRLSFKRCNFLVIYSSSFSNAAHSMASSKLSPQQFRQMDCDRAAARKRRLSCIEGHLTDRSDSRTRIYQELAELNRCEQFFLRKKSWLVCDILGSLVELDRQVIDSLPIANRPQSRVVIDLSDAASIDGFSPSQQRGPDQDCATNKASTSCTDGGPAQPAHAGAVEERRDDAAESEKK
jgi:hypothetical protein